MSDSIFEANGLKCAVKINAITLNLNQKSYETHVEEKNNTEQVTNTQTDDSSKEFACNYKKTEFYKNMNDNNTKAMDVWANEGVDAAVKHMFTDQETGKQLSYAEMRSRYG